MKLYLMRHAESEDGDRLNPERKLTDKGRAQTATMADFMVRQVGRVDLVICSWFVRAMDTAKPMAVALGNALVIETPMLDPDATAKDAWKEIQAITRERVPSVDDPEVVVVTHHPLINDVLKFLTGCKTDEVGFHHAHIAHIKDGKLHWFVGPKMVERDEMMPQVQIALADAVLATLSPAIVQESLRHERHARIIMPLRSRVEGVMHDYFIKQGNAILKETKPRVESLLSQYREAADAGKRFASDLLPSNLQPLTFAVTAQQQDDFNAAITQAITAAAEQMASDMNLDTTIGASVATDWLRDHSLDKLTGDISDTTLDRMRTAIADAFESGGTAQDIISAIESTVEDFSRTRAELVAQTEVNGAYNRGRFALAEAGGFEEKRWSADGTDACEEVCIPNIEQEWLDLADDFESGDSMPPAHPRCDCGIDFRMGAFEDLPVESSVQ